MKIAIICPSEIALRRFMPALKTTNAFEFAGIAYASPVEWFGNDLSSVRQSVIQAQQETERDKAMVFVEQYGGKLYNSYISLLEDTEIQAVYIPLPPSLHSFWANMAIKHNKHVLLEKPATTRASDTKRLLNFANRRKLVIHENYMFLFHSQLAYIDNIISSGRIGDVRLYRICFGFPRRSVNDFRYKSSLGGGALLDCGGYTLRYATYLLGNNAKLTTAHSNYIDSFDVDIFGTATMVNEKGVTAQLAFGMDNDYKCELEIWGSKGTLYTNRILTAPSGYTPTVEIRQGKNVEIDDLPEDDTFAKSILYFEKCILENDSAESKKRTESIIKQAMLVDRFKKMAKI